MHRRSSADGVHSPLPERARSDTFPNQSEADPLKASALAFEGRFSRGGLAALLSEAEEAVAELAGPQQDQRHAHAAGSVRSSINTSTSSSEGRDRPAGAADRPRHEQLPQRSSSARSEGSSLAAWMAGAETRLRQLPATAPHSRTLSGRAATQEAERAGSSRAPGGSVGVWPMTGGDLRASSAVEGEAESNEQTAPSEGISYPAVAPSPPPAAAQQPGPAAAPIGEGQAEAQASSTPLDGPERAAQQQQSPDIVHGCAMRGAEDAAHKACSPSTLDNVLYDERPCAPQPAELPYSPDEPLAHAAFNRTTVEEGASPGMFCTMSAVCITCMHRQAIVMLCLLYSANQGCKQPLRCLWNKRCQTMKVSEMSTKKWFCYTSRREAGQCRQKTCSCGGYCQPQHGHHRRRGVPGRGAGTSPPATCASSGCQKPVSRHAGGSGRGRGAAAVPNLRCSRLPTCRQECCPAWQHYSA